MNDKPARAHTVRELADLLGVSRTTVSLALRNDPRISEKTREKVQRTAHECGYRSNALVSALMTQIRNHQMSSKRNEVIAFLTSSTTENSWKTAPSLMDQFNGARDRAQQIGFDIQPFWLGKECKNAAPVCRILRARGIRASLLAPMPDEHHKLALDLDWDKHLVVAIGRSYYGHNVHRIAHNCYDSVMLCYEQLSRNGYQRIAMALCQNDDERVDYQWSSGYLGAQRRYHGSRLEPLMMQNRSDREHFLKWLKRVKPDALIGIWCHDTLTWAREAGIKIPEDMAYASLDLGDGLQSGISGIFQNNYEIGGISVDVISSHLYHNSMGLPNVPVVSTIDSKWVDGSTVDRRT